MAPTPRRRYSRIPVGLVETLPPSIAQTKPSALVLLLWLLLSPFRRTLPGVVRAGEIMLADSLGWPPAAVRRHRGQLEAVGLVSVDTAARIWWVRSAIGDDPPRNENTLTAWAADLAELPTCPIRDAIRDEISRVVAGLEQGDSLLTKWKEKSQTAPDSSGNSHINSSRNSWGTPVPSPVPVPNPQPQPSPLTERLAPYLLACSRLGEPFAYAAAAARLSDSLKNEWAQISLDEWGNTLQGLSTSFYMGERAKVRPTLIELIRNAKKRADLSDGVHEEEGRTWRCALCSNTHPILEKCLPACQDCRRRHVESYVCDSKRMRLEREEVERERAEFTARELAAAEAEGLTLEEFRAQRAEAARLERKRIFAEASARVGARA